MHQPFFRGRGRHFARGEIKYVVLDLLREKPKHGYEIIKDIEAQFAGLYSPSPGSVYPTLQMLEDLGYVGVTTRAGKKAYEITQEGRAFLAENKQVMAEIEDRLSQGYGPSFHKAMRDLAPDLRAMVGAVLHSAQLASQDPERLRRIREVVLQARSQILDILDEQSARNRARE